jgi:hypothetical protein
LLLDGDQRRQESKPAESIASSAWEEGIAAVTGVDAGSIAFGADGGRDPDAEKKKLKLYERYLDFFHERVRFLPRSCPEEIVLRSLKLGECPTDSQSAKKRLRQYLDDLGIQSSSSDGDAQANLLLAQNSENNEDIAAIAKLLREMLPTPEGTTGQ